MPEESSAPPKKEGASPAPQIKRQTVAGSIVYRRTPEGTKFLLLYRRGNYWNFPKGKFQENEDELKAALRETTEETGIKDSELRIIPGFRTYLKYNFRIGNERIYDTVVLYLAETKKADITIVPREHSGFAWFLYSDAMKILGNKYVGTRRILKQANDFLRKMQGGGRTQSGSGRPHRNHRRRNNRPATSAYKKPINP
jgi:8-oxo-dGTP pyrophosphatase MutT (NUDIX family)